MINQWDTYAKVFEEGMGEGGDELHTKLINPLIFKFLGVYEGKRILDAGCGNGYLVKLLSKQAKHVTGADAAKELLKLAKKRTQKITNIDYTEVNLLDPLPFAHASYEVVIANMVLQYLPQLATFALEAFDVLKPNGQLIVLVDHPGHALFDRAQELAGKPNPKWLTRASYFTSGQRRKKSLWDKAVLEYYHRPVQEYINVFTPYFKLEKIAELTSDSETPRILGFLWSKI